jgi:prepilin-type N-terminal cleavage/methylation domain-containing protein/prepilin-type processing-associated H-X9-DG protein
MDRRGHSGFTLIELLIVIGMIAILIALLVPATQKLRASANRVQCVNNLKQIALAMHGYCNDNGAFPPAFTTPSNYGWGVWILPYVEQTAVWRLLDPLELNGPSVLSVGTSTTLRLPVYTCPSDPAPGTLNSFFLNYGRSNYIANEQICDINSTIGIGAITDGTSNTILAGERDMQQQVAGVWGGNDPAAGGTQTVIGRPNWPINTPYAGGSACCAADAKCTRFAFSSFHPDGANFAFCDGSVHFISTAIDTDATQQNCSRPLPSNHTFFNLYIKDDGYPIMDTAAH